MSPEVTNIGVGAFENCTDITSITIPYGITSINNHTFYGCTGLTDITIPNNVTSIGESAFNGCNGLTSITIPDSVTSMGDYCFQNCQGLTSIAIGSGVNNIGSSEFSGCNNCTIFDFRNSTSVPTLDNVSAFENTPSNKEIVVPDSLYDDWIVATNWSSDTYNIRPCIVKASQSSIGISSRTTHVRYTNQSGLDDWYGEISGTISGRDSRPYYTNQIPDLQYAEEIVIGNTVTSLLNGAFCNCYCTISVTIPNSVTYIANSTLSGDIKLTAINLENDNPTYKMVNGMLLTKNGGVLICVPGGFTSVTIPSSVTSIGDYALDGCQATNVTIPDSVTSIGMRALSEGQLTSMTIPDSVTTLGTWLFAWSYALTSVTIGSGVSIVPANAFYSCSSCMIFDFRRATHVPTLNNVNAFSGTSADKKIIVPDALYDDWISASNWSSSTNGIVDAIISASDYEQSLA